MDDIVKQAVAKWPHVPDCYGWLGLDARGRWYLRDDAVQAAGPFPQSRGSLLQHEKLIEFIHRKYEHDPHGQWFFQNGPQMCISSSSAHLGCGGSNPTFRWWRTRAPEPLPQAACRMSAAASISAPPSVWGWFTPWIWKPLRMPLKRGSGRRKP